MRLIKSLYGRATGLLNTWKSKYWEYSAYYSDSELWEDTILFESFGGTNFQGNPYYLYKEFLHNEAYSQYRLVIAHQRPNELLCWLQKRGLIDARVCVINKDSEAYRNTLSHAKYLVNNVSFNMDFIKKPGQIYLNTWHGTPLKCLGRNIQNDPFECNNAQRNFLLCDYLIAPNVLTKQVFEEDYMVQGITPGQIRLAGYPRNAVLFDEQSRAEVKHKYQMEGVTTVFFMPTWRGTACGIDDVDQVSEIEQLAKDLGEEYRVYVKFHPAMKKKNGAFRYCHNMPDDIEVYEFLNAVDILITDYSSVFFDFANTGKPTVLYQYDKEQYYKSRGVYDEVAQNLPFPVVYDYNQLLSAVKTAKPRNYPEFIERFCPWDSESAARDAAKLLIRGDPKQEESVGVNLYVIDFPVTEAQLLKMKEQLAGTHFRFVFVLKRKTGRFASVHCWNHLEYMVLYTYDRLGIIEKLKFGFCNGLYACFKSKWAYRVIFDYGRREQRRLWGSMKIDHIYAKSRRQPAAVGPFVEAWPKEIG